MPFPTTPSFQTLKSFVGYLRSQKLVERSSDCRKFENIQISVFIFFQAHGVILFFYKADRLLQCNQLRSTLNKQSITSIVALKFRLSFDC